MNEPFGDGPGGELEDGECGPRGATQSEVRRAARLQGGQFGQPDASCGRALPEAARSATAGIPNWSLPAEREPANALEARSR